MQLAPAPGLVFIEWLAPPVKGGDQDNGNPENRGDTPFGIP
jgi:hypothetical protein